MPAGAAIERFASMTNWDYYEAAVRFQSVLQASGAPRKPGMKCTASRRWAGASCRTCGARSLGQAVTGCQPHDRGIIQPAWRLLLALAPHAAL